MKEIIENDTRLADERRKIEEVQIAEREKIEAERQIVKAEKKAFEDAIRAEQDRKDREAFETQAKDNARIAAEKAAKEKIEHEAAEAIRQESLKSDKDKLLSYGHALMDVPRPEIKGAKTKEILSEATSAVYVILKQIHRKTEKL